MSRSSNEMNTQKQTSFVVHELFVTHGNLISFSLHLSPPLALFTYSIQNNLKKGITPPPHHPLPPVLRILVQENNPNGTRGLTSRKQKGIQTDLLSVVQDT